MKYTRYLLLNIISIRLSSSILKLIKGNGIVVKEYVVSTGKNKGNKQQVGDLRTPEGNFKVKEINDSATWCYDFQDGKGPVRGAYGPWFIRLKTGWEGIGIHGTHNGNLVGYKNSHGCIRMRNKDLIELKGHIFIGMNVDIRK